MDSILFGGGIGENSPEIRARICKRLHGCGLQLDPDRNEKMKEGREGRISSDRSSVDVCVLTVDESILIAEQTAELIAPLN